MKFGLLLILLSVVPQLAHADEAFDCTLGEAYSVGSAGGERVVRPINFGPSTGTNWKFSLVRAERTLTIEWPDSPMQLNGKGPLIQTGRNSFASFYVGTGPCLFTEGHCGGMVHFSAQDDGALSIQVQPVALTKFEDGHNEPFVAFIDGRCVARKEQK